jgi:uncharacterized SAM-binding protein YcdF (DUF218 family)
MKRVMSQAHRVVILYTCGLLVCGIGCTEENKKLDATLPPDAIVIVLGNEPLDDSTPTVDMVARVKRAVEYHKQHPGSLLVFTGGKTAGNVSEAAMMWDIARSLGVSAKCVHLEEQARSTMENAKFTAEFVRNAKPKEVLLVSKSDHLEWALPEFRKIDVFKNAEPLGCEVDPKESIAQMREYLAHHNNPRVEQRLQRILDRSKGTD